MIDPVTEWFKRTKYEGKRVISIQNLVETTWLNRYPSPTENTHDQGSEFIGHEFRKSLIEEYYGIVSKTSTFRDTTSNSILEWVHVVIGYHITDI